MSASLDLRPVLSVGTSVLVLAGVAALARQALFALLSNPIPWKEKERLTKSYGAWAVNLAESVCPRSDVACVQREAKRLYEARVSRVR